MFLSLGAEHDGIKGSKCDEWQNFIMAPKFISYNQHNSWRFSNCSIYQIKEFLKYYENNYCLLDTTSIDENDQGQITKVYPGQIYDVNDQCKMLHGNFSSACMVKFEYLKFIMVLRPWFFHKIRSELESWSLF